jgi:hypothetical protein
MRCYTINAADNFLDSLGVQKYVRTTELQPMVDANNPLEITPPGLDIAPVVAFLRRNIYVVSPYVEFNPHDDYG